MINAGLHPGSGSPWVTKRGVDLQHAATSLSAAFLEQLAIKGLHSLRGVRSRRGMLAKCKKKRRGKECRDGATVQHMGTGKLDQESNVYRRSIPYRTRK